MTNIGLKEAIYSLYPDCSWNLFGSSYDGLEWLDANAPKPSENELNDEILRLQEENDNKQYQRQRVSKYPSVGDQLDALFKAGIFPEEMAAQIQAVKDKYPKPTE